MSAAASADPVRRPAPPGTALADLKPGEYLTCGEIDRAGIELHLKRLRAKVLSPVCVKIAEDIYADLYAVSNYERSADHTWSKSYAGDASDAKWAIDFIRKVEKRIDACADSKWELQELSAHYINGNIVIRYTIVDREDPLPDICDWIGDLISESEDAVAEITEVFAEAEGWPAEAERLVEEAEVRASGTTVNA